LGEEEEPEVHEARKMAPAMMTTQQR